MTRVLSYEDTRRLARSFVQCFHSGHNGPLVMKAGGRGGIREGLSLLGGGEGALCPPPPGIRSDPSVAVAGKKGNLWPRSKFASADLPTP